MVALVSAWAVDSNINSGKVARNVSIAGVDVGGLEPSELDQRLATIASTYADTEVVIRTADGAVQTTAGVIGLELDPEATAENVLAVGEGTGVTSPLTWLGGLFGDRTAEAAVRLGEGDDERLAAIVNASQPDPIEPTLEVADGEVRVVAGQAVQIFDISNIREDVLFAAQAGASPIEAQAGSLQLNPTMRDEEAQVYADEFNALSANGISAVAVGDAETFTAEELRTWMVLTSVEDGFEVALDAVVVQAALADRFNSEETTDSADGSITVVDGEVRLGGFVGTACCKIDAGERILEALLKGQASATVVKFQTEKTELDALREIGIFELIGEATTPHACCQSRVINIQLFADLIRGAILQPGETISLNNYVGRRTTERGFVTSGVIYKGRLQTDVGGGISQFATTIFQAMFYAGIDIDKYQAHTLFFSRYVDFEGRRGIESTISFPEPDVQFTNNTPYPIMIWPTYTDTSLRVSVYSTKHGVATVADQATYGSGHCTVIETDRLRTYPDGTEEIDSFRAIYQPSDGIGCDGEPTDPDSITPTPEPTPEPEDDPTPEPTAEPEGDPTPEATPEATAEPTPEATPDPTPEDGGGGL